MTGKDSTKLPIDEVHVWSVALAPPDARALHMASLLSAEEKERAGRLQMPSDRQRFIVGHGTLRILTAHYLNLAPHQVRFEHGTYGKPRIASDLHPTGIEFSYSRSGDMALYAFVRGRSVGVDVERIRPLPDLKDVARTVLAPGEQVTLFALPQADQCTAFYQCWTRKEAYLKATGKGLSSDLGRIEVSLAPGEPARLLRVDGSTSAVARWSLRSLQPAAGYAGAIAVEGNGWHLVQRQWTWENGPQPDVSSPT